MIDQVTSYRTCFSTDAGKRVLASILAEAGYFDNDLKTTEELAVLNFAKTILKNMGVLGSPESADEFVRKIMEILPKGI